MTVLIESSNSGFKS